MLLSYGEQKSDCISRLRDIQSEDDRTPPQHTAADTYSRDRENPRISTLLAVSRKGVCQELLLGGVGVPWPTGVLLLAQTS